MLCVCCRRSIQYDTLVHFRKKILHNDLVEPMRFHEYQLTGIRNDCNFVELVNIPVCERSAFGCVSRINIFSLLGLFRADQLLVFCWLCCNEDQLS